MQRVIDYDQVLQLQQKDRMKNEIVELVVKGSLDLFLVPKGTELTKVDMESSKMKTPGALV